MANNPELKIDIKYNEAGSTQAFNNATRKLEDQAKAHEARLAQLKATAQAKSEVEEQKHQDKIRRIAELNAQKLEAIQTQNQTRMLARQSSWSAKMSQGLETIVSSIKGFAIAYAAAFAGSAIRNAVSFADNIGDLAAAYKITTREVQLLTLQLASAGASADSMSGLFGKIAEKLETIQAGGKDGAKALQELKVFGIDAGDNVYTAFQKIIDATKSGSARVTDLSNVFGKFGKEAYPILQDTATQMELISKYGFNPISQEALDRIGQLNRDLDILQTTLTMGVARAAGSAFGGEGFSGLIKRLNEFPWEGLGTGIKNVSTAMGNLTEATQRAIVPILYFGTLLKNIISLKGLIETTKPLSILGPTAFDPNIQKSFSIVANLIKILPKPITDLIFKLGGLVSKFEILGKILGVVSKAFVWLSVFFAIIDFFTALSKGANILTASLYALLKPFTGLIDLFGANTTGWLESALGLQEYNKTVETQITLEKALTEEIQSGSKKQLNALIARYEQYNDYGKYQLKLQESGYLGLTGTPMTKEQQDSLKKQIEYNQKALELAYKRRELLKGDKEDKGDGTKPPITTETEYKYQGPSLETWIEAVSLAEELARQSGIYENILKSTVDLEKTKLYVVKDTYKYQMVSTAFLDEYNKSIEDYTNNINQLVLSAETEGAVNLKKKEILETLITKYADNADIVKKLKDELDKLNGISSENILGDTFEQQIQRITDLAQYAMSALNGLFDYQKQMRQDNIDAMTAQYEKEKELSDTRLAALQEAGLAQTVYYKKQAALAIETEKAKQDNIKRLQGDAYEAERSANIGKASMEMALGIVRIWSQSGINVILGSIMSALLVATAGAQIATISSTANPYRRRTGGWIPDNGSNIDTVPAMLTPGEYVVNKDAAMRNAETLQLINSGKSISTAPININMYGDVIGTQSFVDDVLVPRIRKSVRAGSTLS